jgi:hypothetical protein
MRGKTKVGIALGLAALATSVVLPAAVSTASTATAKPYYVQWKPGTPLPKVPHGWVLMALPTQAVQAKLKIGQTVPFVTPARAIPDSGGIVNLEAEPDVCAPAKVVKNYGPRWTEVAQSYATVSKIRLTFTYGNGQSSSLEVGLSTTDTPGSFSADGTKSVSTWDSQPFKSTHKRSFNHWVTDFSYEKWRQSCGGGVNYWWVEGYQWDSGSHIFFAKGAPGTPFCVTDQAGSGFTKKTTTASTIQVGFTTPVFTGSAQTGYSSAAAVGFIFHRHVRLCGKNNYPPDNPGFIVAGKYFKK